MHEVVLLVMRYVRGTWRYRWWMLGIAWAICLVGWTIVARMPDQYSASARVYVDTSSVLRPYLKGLALSTSNTQKKIFLMTRTLLSRPNLEKIMRMTDLDLRVTTDKEKEELLTKLKKNIRFKGTRRANLYTITFKDKSPELAKLVVKSLLTIFMEGDLGETRKDQDSAQQFVVKQIDEYDQLIKDTEQKITQFKQQHLDLLPSQNGGYYSRIRSLQRSKEKAALDLSIAEDRLESTRRQIDGEEPSFGLGPTPRLSGLKVDTSNIDRRIQSMKVRLDNLLVKYTERHPDVVSTRFSLDGLESKRNEIIADAKKSYVKGEATIYDVNQNPVFQQMRMSLANQDADVSAKRRLLAEYTSRLDKLEGSLDEAFALESEMREMQGLLSRTKKKHAVLINRMESASLGRKADSNTDTVRFRIIDPPRVPSTPSGPNRVQLSSAVLLGGLAVGFGLAFLMSQFRPTYDERQMMNDILGLPVLGSVNMVWTSDQVHARKVRNVSFVFTLTGLLITFGTVLALYMFNIDLLPRLAQSLNLT